MAESDSVLKIREEIFDGLADAADFADAIGVTESTINVYRKQGLPSRIIAKRVWLR